MKKAYQKTAQEVLSALDVDQSTGLTTQEVKQRRAKYGSNTLPEAKPDSWFVIFLHQFQSPLIYILVIAAGIVFIFGEDKIDALVIIAVVLINAVIGMVQEGKARNILQKLKSFIKTEALVIRDGEKKVINDSELVVGDIIELQEGSRVPADARIISLNSLQIEEAALTGESDPVLKEVDSLKQETIPVGDQANMVFKGTLVVRGLGKAVVVATGQNTQIGKVHKATASIHMDMPLVEEIKRLSRLIIVVIFLCCIALFILGLLQGRNVRDILIILGALFISAIPEGLPIVLTVVLVTGIYRLAQKNVFVKKMHAVEGLGRTQVIAIDKTGTLTRNEMMVSSLCINNSVFQVTGEGYFQEGEIIPDNGQNLSQDEDDIIQQIGKATSLLNGTQIHMDKQTGLFQVKGDPTEAAMLILSKKIGYSQEELKNEYKKIYEIPFNSELRYHAAFYEKNDFVYLFVAGAPEKLMEFAHNDDSASRFCLDTLLEKGLRTVAVGTKKIPLDQLQISPDDEEKKFIFFRNFIERNLTILGFLGIQDAIRPEVKDIIDKTRNVGIKVIMITGDHLETALYVAREVGIFQEGDRAISGPEFDTMDEQQQFDGLDKTTVYARFSPEDKYKIVKLFHKRDVIIAMTGDGINDAPSLMAADLGIAMGSIGTEVAKEAADILLLDDSFVNIVNAIEEGRHIFMALKRVILYLFSTNLAEILVIFFAFVANLPLPLTAVQIIWLNLVTDGFIDIGLAMEPKEKGLLQERKWLKKSLGLIDYELVFNMVYMAIPMALGSIGVFIWYYKHNRAQAHTMTLITLAFFTWFNGFNCRSMKKSIFELNFFANKWLLFFLGFIFLLQLAVVYVPFMNGLFNTVPLTLNQWLSAAAISSLLLVWVELGKLVWRKWLIN